MAHEYINYNIILNNKKTGGTTILDLRVTVARLCIITADAKDTDNFRPIPLLTSLSKFIEKYVFSGSINTSTAERSCMTFFPVIQLIFN